MIYLYALSSELPTAAGGSAKAIAAAETASGATVAAIARSRPLAAVETASGATAATIHRSRALAFASSSLGSEAATIHGSHALASAPSSSTATVSGIARSRAVAMAATASGATAATLHGSHALACSASSAATEAATILRSRALVAAETASSVAATALARSRALAASETAIGVTHATLFQPPSSIACAATGTSSLSATLHANHALSAGLWGSSGPGPATARHYAPNGNLPGGGAYPPGAVGFNLADVSGAPSDLDALPDGVMGLVYLGMTNGADAPFIAAASSYIGHPKLWGFYVADEPLPGIVDPANLLAETNWIRANAPGIKTYLAVENEGTPSAPSFSFNAANTGADYFGLAAYPVRPQFAGGIDLSTIAGYVNAAIRDGIPLAAIVPQYQVFGGGGFPSWTTPTPVQVQALLAAWAAVVPAPGFDVAYSWGVQLGDDALASLPQLQPVMAAHNAVAPTTLGRSRALAMSAGASSATAASVQAIRPLALAAVALGVSTSVVAASRPLACVTSASGVTAATLTPTNLLACAAASQGTLAVALARFRQPRAGRVSVIPARYAYGSSLSFAPIAPGDADTFTFDWTSRTTADQAGDLIVSASVSGADLTVGATTLVSPFVQVECTHATPDESLALRCAVTFASGRVLHWTTRLPVFA